MESWLAVSGRLAFSDRSERVVGASTGAGIHACIPAGSHGKMEISAPILGLHVDGNRGPAGKRASIDDFYCLVGFVRLCLSRQAVHVMNIFNLTAADVPIAAEPNATAQAQSKLHLWLPWTPWRIGGRSALGPDSTPAGATSWLVAARPAARRTSGAGTHARVLFITIVYGYHIWFSRSRREAQTGERAWFGPRTRGPPRERFYRLRVLHVAPC